MDAGVCFELEGLADRNEMEADGKGRAEGNQAADELSALKEAIRKLRRDNEMWRIRCDFLEGRNEKLDKLCDDLQAALLTKDEDDGDDVVAVLPTFPIQKSSQ